MDFLNGLLDTMSYWDLNWGERRQINAARSDAQRAQSEAMAAETHARKVDQRVDQLGLVFSAMWSIVKERTGATDEDLHARIGELGEARAAADAAVPATTHVGLVTCVSCGRPFQQKHVTCIYCGARAPKPRPSPKSKG